MIGSIRCFGVGLRTEGIDPRIDCSIAVSIQSILSAHSDNAAGEFRGRRTVIQGQHTVLNGVTPSYQLSQIGTVAEPGVVEGPLPGMYTDIVPSPV